MQIHPHRPLPRADGGLGLRGLGVRVSGLGLMV